MHCPVGAFEGVGEFEEIESALAKATKDKKAVLVFQIAPSIRTSIGQDFGISPGEAITEKIAAGIKKLGADKVFDVSVGADFTTAEEAKEMVEKIKGEKYFTMFSSCCPAWVRFVEVYYPEFLSNLATARPPHIISGGLIKTYWARNQNIPPEKIIVVSVMPCVAKKYEITRKEFLIDELKPVDYVLTTRELSRLFLKHKINLRTIRPRKLDNPLGIPSGAGVIYGASGGVMESALRNAFAEIQCSKKPKINFKDVRGQESFKTADIKVEIPCFSNTPTIRRKLKVAIVNGTGAAKKLLEELKKKPYSYSCVEVMACPGGCIGGGGQPLPTDGKIRQQRAEGLYEIDAKKRVRRASDNPVVEKIYKEFLTNEQITQKVCHAEYDR